jgi:hypothetical protein
MIESTVYLFSSFKLTKIVSGLKAGTYIKDGDGIGVYFMGLEVNDRVPWNEIYVYRDSFMKKGFLMLLLGVAIYAFHRKMKKGHKENRTII